MNKITLSLIFLSLLVLASCGGGSGGGGGSNGGSNGNQSMDNGDMIGDNNGDGGGGGSDNGTGNNGGSEGNGGGGGNDNGTGNNGGRGGNGGNGGSDNNTGNGGNGGNSGGGSGGGSNNDADNDGVLNTDEEVGCELKPDCDDDEVLDINEEPGCVKKPDCDGDGVDDINEAMGCAKKSDCDDDSQLDSIDIDDDGDGLIEIRNASELDAVRWVLDGTGFKATETAILDQTGCGNSSAIRDCSGYELVRDISLTDFIAKTNATAGWQPIAHDVNTNFPLVCDGAKFTTIFDGNSFEVRGLFINRPTEECIGLFGQVDGTIRHLGVIADEIIGNDFTGGLVGWGDSAKIIQSYVVADKVSSVGPNGVVGTLIARGNSVEIIQSYVVTGVVQGASNLGGLAGRVASTKIIQSYAISSGGLLGPNTGGLVGHGLSSEIIHSYAVSDRVFGLANFGGFVGNGGTARASYWDNETSGVNNDRATGSSGETTSALRSPIGYTDIYATWDDGLMVDAINDNATIWCDEDQSGVIEDDERRENNKVWDFGTSTDYPALRCTGDSLVDQRAWWYLNTTHHKPQLNQTRLDDYLDSTL